jgi:thymidylate kinase
VINIIIVIEGVDGSGKTTQSRMIYEKLKSEGFSTSYIRPVFFLLGFFMSEKGLSVSPRKMQTKGNGANPAFLKIIGLFYAYLSILAIKIYSTGRIVVCDRYFYQYFYDLFGERAPVYVKYFPKPDLTLWLDIGIDSLYGRVDEKDAAVDKKYYLKVMRYYESISTLCRFIKIDGNLEKQVIHDLLAENIHEKIRGSFRCSKD